jgi:acetyltransferase-like isoleucine patch superfamily enzyme
LTDSGSGVAPVPCGVPPDRRTLPWRLRYVAGARLASRLRQAAVLVTHRHCHVEFQGPVHLGPGFSLHIPGPGTLVVGPGVEFRRRFHCEISDAGRVTIGAGTVCTFDVLIQCTTSVDIGEGCVLAQSVLVVDGSHRFRDPTAPMLGQGYDFRPIRIGDRASIMAKATVIADVGEGAFVAAGAVVTRAVPPYCLVAGVPARVVDYFGPADRRPAELDAPAR